MWTVIMHFGRGGTRVFDSLTKEKAEEMIRIAVFNNEDCINFSCFRQTEDFKYPNGINVESRG